MFLRFVGCSAQSWRRADPLQELRISRACNRVQSPDRLAPGTRRSEAIEEWGEEAPLSGRGNRDGRHGVRASLGLYYRNRRTFIALHETACDRMCAATSRQTWFAFPGDVDDQRDFSESLVLWA